MRAFTFDVLEAKGGRVIGRVTIADGPPRRLVQKAIRWAQRQGVVLGKARVARRVATDSGVEYLTVTWMAE